MDSRRRASRVLAVGLVLVVVLAASGVGSQRCWGQAFAPALPPPKDPPCPPQHPLPGDLNGQEIADPINNLTGKFTEVCTDFRLPGVGVDFVIQRNYISSIDGQDKMNDPTGTGPMTDGQYGINWKNNYGMRLSSDGKGTITLIGGSADVSINYSGKALPDDGTCRFPLIFTSSGYQWQRENLIYTFFNSGAGPFGCLQSIQDKAGHALTFHYPTGCTEQLYDYVTDTMSRTHLVERIPSGFCQGYIQRIRVCDAYANDIAWIEYGYSDDGDLVRAVLTDKTAANTGQRVWLYNYDTNHQMLHIVDPAGYRQMCTDQVQLSDSVTLIGTELSLTDSRWTQPDLSDSGTTNQYLGLNVLDPNLTADQWLNYAMVTNTYGSVLSTDGSFPNRWRVIKQVCAGREGEGRINTFSWSFSRTGLASQPPTGKLLTAGQYFLGNVVTSLPAGISDPAVMLVTESNYLTDGTPLGKTINSYVDYCGRELRKEVDVGVQRYITDTEYDIKGHPTHVWTRYDDGSGNCGPDGTLMLHRQYLYGTLVQFDSTNNQYVDTFPPAQGEGGNTTGIGTTINGYDADLAHRDFVTEEMVTDGVSGWRRLMHCEYAYYMYMQNTNSLEVPPNNDSPMKWDHLVTLKETFTVSDGSAGLVTQNFYDGDGPGNRRWPSFGLLTTVISPTVSSGLDATASQQAYTMTKSYTFYTATASTNAAFNQVQTEQIWSQSDSAAYMTTSYAYCSTDNSTTGLYAGRIDTVWVDSGGLNLATQTRYDPAGNVAKVIKDPGGLNIETDLVNDAWGDVIKSTSPEGYVTTTTRDASGRPLKVVKQDSAGNLLAQTENQWDVYGEQTQTKALFGTNATDDGSKTITQIVRNYSGSIVVVDSVGDTRTDYTTSNAVQAGSRVEYDQRGLVAANYVCDQWTPSNSQSTSPGPWGTMWVSNAFTYDWAGRVLQEAVYADDGTGTPYLAHSTSHTYDSWGRLVTTRYSEADSSHSLQCLTRTDLTYDELDRVVKTTLLNKDTSSPGPADYLNITLNSYDELGRVWRTQTVSPSAANINQPSAATEAITNYVYHDAYGHQWKTRDEAGNTTVFTYDKAGRTIEIDDPVGNRVMTSFDNAGRVWQGETDEIVSTGSVAVTDSAFTYIWYDPEGRTLASANYGVCTVAPLSWSAYQSCIGNLQNLKPDGTRLVVQTTYSYDTTEAKEYVSTLTFQGSTSPATLIPMRSYHYVDKLARTAKTVEDANSTADNLSGRIARVTTWGYDKAGHLTSQTAVNPCGDGTDNDDQTTTYYFNARGQDVRTIYADGHWTGTAFDSWDALALSRTDQIGTVVNYQYAAVPIISNSSVYGRRQVESVASFGTSVSSATAATVTVTDGLTRPVFIGTYSDAGLSNQTTAVTHTYKWHGALATETEQLGSASVLTIGYKYLADEVTSTTSGDKRTLRGLWYPYSGATGDYLALSSSINEVDALGRVSKATWYRAANQTTTALAAYTYEGVQLSSKTCNPDGTNPLSHVLRNVTTNNNDRWDHPIRDLITAGGTTLVDQQYAYDVAEDITWQNDARITSWSTSYQYDTLDRLVTAARGTVSNWPTAPALTVSYQWDWSGKDGSGLAGLDKLGNWHVLNYGAPGATFTDSRTHDLVNKISTRSCTGKNSPTWDATGNLVCDGDTSHQIFGSSTQLHFVYDYRNRLVSATTDSGNVVAAYVYDGLNRRVEKTLYNSTGAATADTWFLWSDWQCVEECNHLSGDAVLRQHVYGVCYLDDQSALINSDGTIYYYLQDRLHNVAALAAAGATSTTERYRYDPYGALLITDDSGNPLASSTVGNGFTFTGQFYDPDLNLYYYKNRWYSPDLGRFTTEDPAGYKDGMNLYQYVSSMPMMLTDMLGLFEMDVVSPNIVADDIPGHAERNENRVGAYFGTNEHPKPNEVMNSTAENVGKAETKGKNSNFKDANGKDDNAVTSVHIIAHGASPETDGGQCKIQINGKMCGVGTMMDQVAAIKQGLGWLGGKDGNKPATCPLTIESCFAGNNLVRMEEIGKLWGNTVIASSLANGLKDGAMCGVLVKYNPPDSEGKGGGYDVQATGEHFEPKRDKDGRLIKENDGITQKGYIVKDGPKDSQNKAKQELAVDNFRMQRGLYTEQKDQDGNVVKDKNGHVLYARTDPKTPDAQLTPAQRGGKQHLQKDIDSHNQ